MFPCAFGAVHWARASPACSSAAASAVRQSAAARTAFAASPARLIAVFVFTFIPPLVLIAQLLLKAEQDEYLARPARERLKGLADDCAGAVYGDAAEFERLRPHRHARHVARHQKVADLNRAARRVG